MKQNLWRKKVLRVFFHMPFLQNTRRLLGLLLVAFALALLLMFAQRQRPSAPPPDMSGETIARRFFEYAPAIYGIAGTVTRVEPQKQRFFISAQTPLDAEPRTHAVTVSPKTVFSLTTYLPDSQGAIAAQTNTTALARLEPGSKVVVSSDKDVRGKHTIAASYVQVLVPFSRTQEDFLSKHE